MYKFGKRISVLLIAVMLMVTVTGCGNKATDGKDTPEEPKAEQSAEITKEAGEAEGVLEKVDTKDDGKAVLVFDTDGEKVTLETKSSELYKFTIGSPYSFSYDEGEIKEFKLVEEAEEE